MRERDQVSVAIVSNVKQKTAKHLSHVAEKDKREKCIIKSISTYANCKCILYDI